MKRKIALLLIMSLILSPAAAWPETDQVIEIQALEKALAADPANKKILKKIESAEKKIEAEKKKAIKEAKEPKKNNRGFFTNIFRKETGLVKITEPVQEAAQVLSLDECIKIAMANAIPLRVAAKNIKLAEMRVFEARRNMLPSATIVYEESTGRVNARRYAGRKQYIEGQQPIFHGGELFYTMKQQETNLKVMKGEYEKTKNELTLQVKKGYYSLVKSKENLKLQQDLSIQADIIYDRVIKEFDAGVTSRLELLNVTSQQGQVKYQLASAEGDLHMAELILKQAMNIDTKEMIDIQSLPEFKKIPVDFDEALRAAFMNRPEIRISSFTVDYYNFGKNVAKAKGWPKIDLLGSWGLAKEDFVLTDFVPTPAGTSDDVQSAQDNPRRLRQQWYAGIKASMPIEGSTVEYSHTREQWVPVVSTTQGTEATTSSIKFKILDKLDYYSDKQIADIDLEKARQELVKAKNDVTLEVHESCFNYEKALIQLETSEKKVKYQETDLEVARFKREMDEAQDSNVVDSMIKLAQEKFGHVQAVTDCYTSIASINKAIGISDYFKIDTESVKETKEVPKI